MKEISIEEKAYNGNYKVYTELINRLEDVKDAIKKQNYGIAMDILCKPYPEFQITTSTELKESEGEKIRKVLVELVKCNERSGYFMFNNITTSSILAWLEKQGEQKPANKVEPKFKVGDWVVVDGVTQQVTQIQPEGFDTDRAWNGKLTFKDVHLWTIKDAKAGDVLACESGWTCIFKKLVNDETFSSYCFMDNTKWFCETGGCHTLKEEFVKAYNGKIYPATKEQRDLLFQKMKEAGYEWDAEKKELKKIEKKSTWNEDDERIYQSIIDDTVQENQLNGKQTDWLRDIKHRYFPQPKQEWSEEDEAKLKSILFHISDVENKDVIDWLKSLKDRVQQKQEWSEEDKNRINRLIAYFEDKESFTAEDDVVYANWLKSLRPQNTWKPSDEQMDALDAFIEKACEWIKMMWSETDDRFKEDYTEMLVENFKNYMKGE